MLQVCLVLVIVCYECWDKKNKRYIIIKTINSCHFSYISHYYKDTYTATYSGMVNLFDNECHWGIPNSIKEEVVALPI